MLVQQLQQSGVEAVPATGFASPPETETIFHSPPQPSFILPPTIFILPPTIFIPPKPFLSPTYSSSSPYISPNAPSPPSARIEQRADVEAELDRQQVLSPPPPSASHFIPHLTAAPAADPRDQRRWCDWTA